MGMPRPRKGMEGQEDERSPAETERIREATLKTLLNTPPKSHAAMVEERRVRGRKSKGTDK